MLSSLTTISTSENIALRRYNIRGTDIAIYRVEALSSSPFSSLRRSIRKLQKASIALDAEKAEAETKFKQLLKKLPRRELAYSQIVYQRVIRFLKREFWFEDPSPTKEFVKAAKRVQKANSKLVAFEKGFLHEDGIKDREWYKHLGVAPGKWLGKFCASSNQKCMSSLKCF